MSKTSFKGPIVAALIVVLWLASLVLWLSADLSSWPSGPVGVILVGLAMAWQTFLYTGLFITAHDAMHGTVCPSNRRFNDIIGALCVRLYALFSYRKLRQKHWKHHRHPASADDPDFHDGHRDGFGRWYARFVSQYIGVGQLVGMAVVYNVLHHLVGVDLINLNLFWVAPALLSTVQLFYFGTYLPHRRPPDGYPDHHRATSNDYSVFWSFLSCYHFGYHREHHAQPSVPWWRLPRVRPGGRMNSEW